MLVLLAFLAGVSAFYDGVDVCFVAGDYTGISDTSLMTINRNPNFGTFLATAYSNNTVTTTYKGEYLKITIASNGTDRLAGILGYFADSTQLGDPAAHISPSTLGDWMSTTNITQTYWSPCSSYWWKGFTNANTSYWGPSQSEVSIAWTFSAPSLYRKSLTSGAYASTDTSLSWVLLYEFSGTLYWMLEIGISEFETRTPEEVKAGQSVSASSRTWNAYRWGNITHNASAISTELTVSGLIPDTLYTLHYFVDIIDPPTVSFQAYVISGDRGNSLSQQLYRSVAGEPDNLVLTPATTPLPSRVQSIVGITRKAGQNAASPVGPTMLLITLCLLANALNV